MLRKTNRASRVLAVALLAVALGAAGFVIARLASDGSTAAGQPQDQSPVATFPADDETPAPGATPDLSAPFWFVPYLNRDGTLPPFEGTIAGIHIGPADIRPEDEGYCEGSRDAAGADAEAMFDGSVVGLSPGVRARGDLYRGPTYTVCPDGVARRMEAVVMVKGTPPPGAAADLGTGWVTVIRFIGLPQSPVSGPAERWSEQVLNGTRVAVLRPVIESVGTSAMIFHDTRTGVTTAVWGSGVYLQSVQSVLEELLP
jgi:hypothetical protein